MRGMFAWWKDEYRILEVDRLSATVEMLEQRSDDAENQEFVDGDVFHDAHESFARDVTVKVQNKP
jgi:chorismate-pyruvate lyase